MKNQALIQNIYLTKGVSLNNYESPRMESIGFLFEDFIELVSLLKNDSIKIESVELFEIRNKEFIPPDFWYDQNSLEKCYLGLDQFLTTLVNKNNFYYAISIITDSAISIELKIILDKLSIKL